MFSSSRVLLPVALVFLTRVSVEGWSQRSNLIDLGTSVVLPWESKNRGGLGNPIYTTVHNSNILRLRNIQNQNLIRELELQQQLRNLGRISSKNKNRNQYLSQDVVAPLSQQNSLRVDSNGYTRLGAYSSFDSGTRNEQRQDWRDNTRQDSSLYLNQGQNYELNRIPTPGSGSTSLSKNAENELGNILASRLNKYNQLSNLRIGQPRTSSTRLVRLNKLFPSQNQNNLWNANQEELEQNIPRSGDNSEQILHSLRSLNEQRINRPIGQQTLDGGNAEEQTGRTISYEEEPSLRILENVEYRPQPQILPGPTPESSADTYQTQNLQNFNQEQRNIYTYAELSAKIWNVIKNNPTMLSNLENLREQLQSNRNPENDQIRQLKGLVQEASQYSRYVNPNNEVLVRSPEEYQQNAVVATLIDAMNSRNSLDTGRTIRQGGWDAGNSWRSY